MRGRRGRRLGWLALALALAACSANAAGSAPAPTAPPGGAVVVAHGSAFDRDRIEIVAGDGVPLLFENRDGAPHNVSILDPGTGAPLFVGEVFGGPASRTYVLPALARGLYPFRCDVHPEMTGTIDVEEAGPAGS